MKYQNPIVRGYNPDPSICRVGEDYYLVTSTFEFFPGIPVYHSRDLINWTQIGNCIERTEQLPMETAKINGGVWAPTIRYHEGKFYVTAKFQGFGNFIISSEDPATGWSDPVMVDIGGIDPSILFEDDKGYYCTNHRVDQNREAISMVEINVETGEMLSEIREIWNGAAYDCKPQYLEAPHIYHIGDWYYILGAEGGTGFGHMITAARSKNIWGPYENCPRYPILTNRFGSANGVECSGHGDLLEDHNGNWWMVHLATRPDDRWYSHLGREAFLLPVTWEDEWPVVADGRSHIECEGPLWAEQKPLTDWNADLSVIEPRWLFIRKPNLENYIRKDGKLYIRPSVVWLSDTLGSPTFMAVRHMDIDCTTETKLNFSPTNEGEEAGMTIYICNIGYYTFGIRREEDQNYLVIDKSNDAFDPIRIKLKEGTVSLKIEAFKKEYILSYAVGENDYEIAATVPVLVKEEAGKCFTGTLIGIYAQSKAPTENTAEIISFSMKKC